MGSIRGDSSNADFMAAAAPHLDALWSVARRLTADRCAAEDAVQETFLRAFRGFGGQGRGEMRPWLLTICVNVVRSEHRRAQRRPIEQHDDGSWAVAVSPDDVVAATALAHLDRTKIVRGLQELPDAQRVALTLVDIGGLTVREAAEAERVPLGTMLSRVHRGRRHLARFLTRTGVHDG